MSRKKRETPRDSFEENQTPLTRKDQVPEGDYLYISKEEYRQAIIQASNNPDFISMFIIDSKQRGYSSIFMRYFP